MKTWIIILSIMVVVFFFLSIGISNHIRNDRTERVFYWLMDGKTTAGVLYVISVLLFELSFVADIVLLLIYFL